MLAQKMDPFFGVHRLVGGEGAFVESGGGPVTICWRTPIATGPGSTTDVAGGIPRGCYFSRLVPGVGARKDLQAIRAGTLVAARPRACAGGDRAIVFRDTWCTPSGSAEASSVSLVVWLASGNHRPSQIVTRPDGEVPTLSNAGDYG